MRLINASNIFSCLPAMKKPTSMHIHWLFHYSIDGRQCTRFNRERDSHVMINLLLLRLLHCRTPKCESFLMVKCAHSNVIEMNREKLQITIDSFSYRLSEIEDFFLYSCFMAFHWFIFRDFSINFFLLIINWAFLQ